MKYTQITILVLLFYVQASNADVLDSISKAYAYSATHLSMLITQTNCENANSFDKHSKEVAEFIKNNPTCLQKNAKNEKLPTEAIHKNLILNELGKLEVDNFKCSISRWNSLKESTNNDVKKTIINQMNTEIPILSFLKKSINKLISKNQLLRGQYSKNTDIQLTGKSLVLKNEYDENQKEINLLTQQYSLHMDKITNANHPFVKAFIEDHLEGVISDEKKVTTNDFDELLLKVTNNLKSEKNSLEGNLVNSNLTSDQENKIIDNLENITILENKYPQLKASISALRCERDQQIKGKSGVETVLIAGSVLFTGGAMGVTAAVRTGFMIKRGEQAIEWSKKAILLSRMGLITGSVENAHLIYNHCARDMKQLKPSCNINIEEIKQDSQLKSCVQAGALASLSGAAWVTKKLANKSSELNAYWLKRSESLALQKGNTQLDNLNKEITISGANGVRYQATIEKFPLSTDANKLYVVKYTNPATGVVHQAKFNQEQLALLNPANRAVLNNVETMAGLEVKELDDIDGWKLFFEAEKNQTAKSAGAIPFTSTDQPLKIIKQIEPPVVIAPATVVTGELLKNSGFSNKYISIISTDSMQAKSRMSLEILEAVNDNGVKKFKVRILDPSIQTYSYKTLTPGQIKSMNAVESESAKREIISKDRADGK